MNRFSFFSISLVFLTERKRLYESFGCVKTTRACIINANDQRLMADLRRRRTGKKKRFLRTEDRINARTRTKPNGGLTYDAQRGLAAMTEALEHRVAHKTDQHIVAFVRGLVASVCCLAGESTMTMDAHG